MKFPSAFVDTIVQSCGEKGELWLKKLPALITDFQKKWSLDQLTLVNNLSYNCVLKGIQKKDHSPIVLKLSPPSSEFEHEVRTLQIYNGQGVVKILEMDMDQKVYLLEALVPGNTLKTFFPEKDEQAVVIFSEVKKKLHSCHLPKNLNEFPTLENWLSVFNNSERFPFSDLISKANNISKHLLETQKSIVLLHGDLHQENILLNHNEWISIDPKGVIGDASYEAGAFIRNPIPDLLRQPNVADILKRRFDLLSIHLNIEKSRLINWSFVQSVLAACWAHEDKVNWEQWIKLAQLIRAV